MNNILEVVLRLRDEASAALAKLSQSTQTAQKGVEELKGSLNTLQTGLQGLGSSIAAVVGGVGLGAFLRDAAMTAREAQVSLTSLQITAQRVGVDFGALQRALQGVGAEFGLMPAQLAGPTAQLLRAGFSTEQIATAFRLAAASAMQAGKDAATGIENVAQALATRQSIYLNYIGIAENIAPVLQQVSERTKGLSEAQRIQAENQALVNMLLKAAGVEYEAVNKSQDPFTKAQKELNQNLYQIKVTIGQAILPALTALNTALAEGLKLFLAIPEPVRNTALAASAAGGALLITATAAGALLPVLKNTHLIITGLIGAIRTGLIPALLTLAANPIGAVALGLSSLAAAATVLTAWWLKNAESSEELRRRLTLLAQGFVGLVETLKGVAQAVMIFGREVWEQLHSPVKALVQVTRGDFGGAVQTLQAGFSIGKDSLDKLKTAGDQARRGLELLSATFRGEVKDAGQRAFESIESFIAKLKSLGGTTQNSQQGMSNLAAGMGQVASAAGEATKKVKELDDATKNLLERAGMLTRTERERRAPRDWSEVDVEGALLEAKVAPYVEAQQTLLQNRAFETAMARRMAEEGRQVAEQFWAAFSDQISALWSGGRAEQATIDAIRRSFSSFQEAVSAGADIDLAARAFSTDFVEGVNRALDVAFSASAPGYADVGAMISAGLLEGANGSWARFRQEVERQAAEAARIAEEAARNQMRIISEVMAEAEKGGQIDIGAGLKDLLQGPLYSVLTAVQTGALSASEGIYALYDAADNARRTLTALYEAGEISAEEFQRGTQSLALYEGAIADLRMQVLQSIGPIVELGNAVAEMGTGDFAPALTTAMSRLDEFRSYLDAIAEIEDPVERLRQLADLEGWLASAMPGLEELIRALEEAGIDADIVREVLEILVQRMRELKDESKRVQLDQEAQRWTRAIQQVASAIQGISDAFNAPTFGQGIAKFASSIGQLAALIPGGQVIGGLIGAVGGLIGFIWDGIASAFDSGWERAQAKIREATAKWDLVDPALAQRAVETYVEPYLFGLIQVTKYRVNEELLQQIQEAARTAENAVQGGLQAALNAAARGEDWREALRQSLYSTTLNAVVNALMQSEAIKAALGPLTTALAEAILSGNAEAIAAATAALAQGMEALGPLFESLGQALGELLPRQLSEAEKSIQDLTASLEGGITGAVKSALQAGLRGEDWQAELSSRIREGILSAVVDAAVTQAVVQGALGPLIDGMVEAILTSNWQAVSTLSGMITTQTEVLVGGLLQGMHPLVSVFSDLSQSATRASESLERVAGSATNLPSWYRLEEVRGAATRTIVVNVQGSIYGVDDLRRVLEEANAVGVYANTGGWR